MRVKKEGTLHGWDPVYLPLMTIAFGVICPLSRGSNARSVQQDPVDNRSRIGHLSTRVMDLRNGSTGDA